MRTPLRELVRSLLRGEPPRSERKVQSGAAWGVDVSCAGEVLDVQTRDGILWVTMDGEWCVTDLDEHGVPLSIQTDRCTGELALEEELTGVVGVGTRIGAVSTTSFTGGFSSRVQPLPS